MSDEEKFRKAEEIYNRRRNVNVTVPTRNLNRNTEKKDLKRFRKMLFQIGICVCIYFSIYFIQYSNYYFSGDVIKKVEEILAYDINFNESFKHFNEYMKNNKFFNGIFSFFYNGEGADKSILENTMIENTTIENTTIENTMTENNINENIISENLVVENTINSENIVQENVVNTMDISKVENENDIAPSLGIGGGEGSNISTDDIQMNSDAKAVKENYQITLPLRGTITSSYGDREIEPAFHTGIDIARDTGSEIISATNGTVILAEEQKSYGKVIKIQNGDLVTLYAHCNEILVNVGDKINMMQKIAKVGSTGNSTGPHLHFEIIYCGRYVNPELVLEFKE